MAVATFTKFDSFVLSLAHGKHNLGTNDLKVALTLTAPPSTGGTNANITEIANGNGYVFGGHSATVSSSAQTGGVYKLVLADPVLWTATGGSMADFRYAVLYDNTVVSKDLIGYWDYGTTITLTSGQTFLVDLDGSAGVFTIT